MKKLRRFILLFLLALPFYSICQNPFFMEKNDKLYFVIYYESYMMIHEAFADYFYHSFDATRFFSAGEFVQIEKDENPSLIESLSLNAPFGLRVYYNGIELFMQDTGMVASFMLAEIVGAEYSKIVIPDWLEGAWDGVVYSRNHTNSIHINYSFNEESEFFEARYKNQERPAQIIIDSVSDNYVRCTELYFMNDMVRKFGSWGVEFKLLKESNTLYVKYPPYSKNKKLGIGFLEKNIPDKN